jgi:hypothetical protein
MEETYEDDHPQVACQIWTIEQAGKIVGVSRAQAYVLARSGQLPTLRLGHRLVVPKVQLDRLLRGENADAGHTCVMETGE